MWWHQVDGGMPSGVHHLLSANLTAHLAALYDEWGSILCVRTGPVRAGSQCSGSRQLEFPLAAAKPSSFFHFSILSSQTAVSSFLFFCLCPAWKAQHVFPLPRSLCHLTFCLFHFHFQHSAHTLIQTDLLNLCKSAGWSKSCNHKEHF